MSDLKSIGVERKQGQPVSPQVKYVKGYVDVERNQGQEFWNVGLRISNGPSTRINMLCDVAVEQLRDLRDVLNAMHELEESGDE